MAKAIYESVMSAVDLKANQNLVSIDGSNVPSNQQILDAAKKAYTQFQAAVDSATLALANIIGSGSMYNQIVAIDHINWQGSVDKTIVDPFYSSDDVKTAMKASMVFSELHSFSVGVFSKALPNGGVGMVGFDRNVHDATPQSLGIAAKLDIYKHIVKVEEGKNLQFGIWLPEAGKLNDSVYGFYTDVVVSGVHINLKIMITTTLNPYGFVVSSGAKVEAPVGAAVFAGTASSPVF